MTYIAGVPGVRNGNQAREFALNYTRENPGKYVIIVNDFGPAFIVSDRLDVQAPSDSFTGTYFRNGEERQFTDRQRAADWRATPALA